mmetsp:Transcript_4920/g.18186  ORF Transcript_4920/g.18186 Transcript_4920/m.18186 type:complete len:213 (+) Transcript_4920:20-658(+)
MTRGTIVVLAPRHNFQKGIKQDLIITLRGAHRRSGGAGRWALSWALISRGTSRRRRELGRDLGLNQEVDEAGVDDGLGLARLEVLVADGADDRVVDQDAPVDRQVLDHLLVARSLVPPPDDVALERFDLCGQLLERLRKVGGAEVPEESLRRPHGVCRGLPRDVQVEGRPAVLGVAAALPRDPRVHGEVLQRLHLRVRREAGHGEGDDGGVP